MDGFDLIVDCSGNPDAIQDAFRMLWKGGMINVYGCCPKVMILVVKQDFVFV